MDKFKFAELIAYIQCMLTNGAAILNSKRIQDLHSIIQEGMPETVETELIQHARNESYRLGLRDGGSKAHTMLTLMAEGQRIDAIRLHRELTGRGLKDSKDVIEAAMNRKI